MSTNHPARNARQMIGAASLAAFVGAAVAIATHGHNGTTQPAGANVQTQTTTPATTPSTSSYLGGDDGTWGATPPDDGWQGNGQFDGGGTGASNPFNAPSHTQSGGS